MAKSQAKKPAAKGKTSQAVATKSAAKVKVASRAPAKAVVPKAALVSRPAAVKAASAKASAAEKVVEKPVFRPEDGLKKKELERFRVILLEKRDEILGQAQRTLHEDMTLDSDDLADEMDLASSEYLQSFTFRLRGREKTFLKKIDKALAKIDDGSFGICEDCSELISIKRLEARPETTLCIRCKEDQERVEKSFG